LTLCLSALAAQAPEPPLAEKRLPVHTLLREDLFAAFMENDQERLARGEKNIELLLEQRPADRPSLLAWKASAAIYRAVRAHEAGDRAGFDRLYASGLTLLQEARQLAPEHGSVAAITGGVYVLFGDRLPEEKRAAAWATAYDAYRILWKQQEPVVDRLPVHLRGELLAGLAQSAQRTGRAAEMEQFLDRMLAVLKETPYEGAAREWKSNPQAAATGNLTCRSCHEPGRLADRLKGLDR
jgi:hypothetical protein